MAKRGLPMIGEGPEVEIPLYDERDLAADLQVVGREKLAERITGGLSMTTKMPCPSWGISAFRCKVGSLLAEVEDSTCSGCYARKGRFVFSNVQAKLEERYRGLASRLWTPSMIYLIAWNAGRYFRFFDSGDLQGVNHLKNICTVARNVPDCRMWLPTRESAVVRACRDEVPPNLTVRVSAAMIDGKAPRGFANTSTVVTEPDPEGESFACPSAAQGNRCGDCRSCWDPAVKDVAYSLH